MSFRLFGWDDKPWGPGDRYHGAAADASRFAAQKRSIMMSETTRRNLLTGAAATAAMSPFASSAFAPIGKKPNILFIVADDLGYADVGCFGARSIATPFIDTLARDGVRFTQGYANSPVCSATRLALITGRYQYRLRAGLEEPIPTSYAKAKSSEIGLPPSHPTMPSLLRKLGYRTGLFGKWHMGYPPFFGPLKSGYDEFFGYLGGGVDYFTHRESVGGETALVAGEQTVDRPGYLTDLLADRTIDFIHRSAAERRPFIASLHFNAPHWPWEGPEDAAHAAALKNMHDWDGGTRAVYARMVEAMDTQIGRVLLALEAEGLTRDTIVVFTSDNGGERFSDVWPFTGIKGEVLEGGIRVPLLMRWPGGGVPAGFTSDQVVMSMDWLPTLLAAAGGRPDRHFVPDGIDILPHIKVPIERTLFWRFKAYDQKAVRSGDWKYLSANGNEFLFNLVDDPMERANRKTHEPDRFMALKNSYSAWNANMLPQVSESYTYKMTGAELPGHYAIPPGH